MAEIDYTQPDFYRFSEDSILLANFVADKIKDFQNMTVMDVGAGSGVIGLELSRKAKNITKMIFLEVQEAYKPFLLKNIHSFLPSHIQHEIYIADYNTFNIKEKVDVMVCNPPYFFLESGRVSPDPKKAKARSFTKDDFKNLFSFFKRGLRPQGVAYFCGPKDWEQFQMQYGFKSIKKLEHINVYEFNSLLQSSF